MDIITIGRLNRAMADVQDDLMRHGFWDDATAAPDVYLVTFGTAYGWQGYGGGGHIYIPALGLSKLGEIFSGGHTSLRDVLRHEYAHAVADTHRGLVRSSRFKEAFGDSHRWDQEYEFDADIFISEYAATAPAEDFAEVFMWYLKCDGELPKRFNHPAIRAKWRFVRELGRAIDRGWRTWRRG